MCEGRGAGFSHGAEPQVPQHLPQQDTGDVGAGGSASRPGAGRGVAGDLFVVVQQSGEATDVFIHTCWIWTNQRLYVLFFFPFLVLILEFTFASQRLASFHFQS